MSVQKHLGLILDEELTLNQHLRVIIEKASKSISILHKICFRLT